MRKTCAFGASDDGHLVLMSSDASGLYPGDINGPPYMTVSGGAVDVFLVVR